MRCRMSAKLVEVVRLNGSRAGCHDRFSSRRAVGGEVFYLDSPFIEPTIRPPIDHQRLKEWKHGAKAPPQNTARARFLALLETIGKLHHPFAQISRIDHDLAGRAQTVL